MLYIVQLNLNIIEGDLQRAKNKMHAKISTHASLCVYDSKFERIIITKLDYIPINTNIKYDEVTQDFYIDNDYTQVPPPPLTVRKIVKLTDREYFCNKSFTMSFNFNTKSWKILKFIFNFIY